MRGKKKALGERADNLRMELNNRVDSWIELHLFWKVRDGMPYMFLPGDLIEYCQRYHPRGWYIFAEIITPVIASILGAVMGSWMVYLYFTH